MEKGTKMPGDSYSGCGDAYGKDEEEEESLARQGVPGRTLVLCRPDAAAAAEVFSARWHWLVPSPSSDIGVEESSISRLPLRLDSNFYVYRSGGGGGGGGGTAAAAVEEWYRVKSGPLLRQTLFSWSDKGGFDQLPLLPSKWSRYARMGFSPMHTNIFARLSIRNSQAAPGRGGPDRRHSGRLRRLALNHPDPPRGGRQPGIGVRTDPGHPGRAREGTQLHRAGGVGGGRQLRHIEGRGRGELISVFCQKI